MIGRVNVTVVDDFDVVVSSQQPYTSSIFILEGGPSDVAFVVSIPKLVVILPCIINLGWIYGGTLQVVVAAASSAKVGKITEDEDKATIVAKQRDEKRISKKNCFCQRCSICYYFDVVLDVLLVFVVVVVVVVDGEVECGSSKKSKKSSRNAFLPTNDMFLLIVSKQR
jgi:hypothetical protein